MFAEMEIGKQWVAKADNDLLNADNNLSAERIPLDTVCFHCQQAAEKLLKAFLAANGQAPPHTHDLLYLLELVLAIDETAEQLHDDLLILTPYAIEVRYPDDSSTPSTSDAREARDCASRVRNWLKTRSPALFCPGSEPAVEGGE
jgi:HEPN domain-containing protein